jgi:hypothetical protein
MVTQWKTPCLLYSRDSCICRDHFLSGVHGGMRKNAKKLPCTVSGKFICLFNDRRTRKEGVDCLTCDFAVAEDDISCLTCEYAPQVGMEAVYEAAIAYNEQRGAKLSTYAYTRIRFRMWKVLQDENRTVQLTNYHVVRIRHMEKAMKKCGRYEPCLLPPT